LGKFLAQDEDTVVARRGRILSQMTGEANIAEHFTLLAGVGSVYVCMYVCMRTATNCSRRGKRRLSFACCIPNLKMSIFDWLISSLRYADNVL